MPLPEQIKGIRECVHKIVTDVGVYKAYLVSDGKEKTYKTSKMRFGPYWYFWPKKRRGEFAYYFGKRKPKIYGRIKTEWNKWDTEGDLRKLLE